MAPAVLGCSISKAVPPQQDALRNGVRNGRRTTCSRCGVLSAPATRTLLSRIPCHPAGVRRVVASPRYQPDTPAGVTAQSPFAHSSGSHVVYIYIHMQSITKQMVPTVRTPLRCAGTERQACMIFVVSARFAHRLATWPRMRLVYNTNRHATLHAMRRRGDYHFGTVRAYINDPLGDRRAARQARNDDNSARLRRVFYCSRSPVRCASRRHGVPHINLGTSLGNLNAVVYQSHLHTQQTLKW